MEHTICRNDTHRIENKGKGHYLKQLLTRSLTKTNILGAEEMSKTK